MFPLLLFWLFFEFGRPARPFGIPLAISIVAVLVWLVTRQKQLSRQTPLWFVLIAVMALGVSYAPNTYAAYMSTRNMSVLFVCICLPLQAQITSVRRLRSWILTFIAIAAYVGGWAAVHSGYGPGGAGKYDENYVAALMGMAVGLTYFAFLAEKNRTIKALLIAAIVIFIAAVANGQNPSRGGFLGLCAVGAYCVARSPKKWLGIALLSLMGMSLVAIAGPAFWAEIGTSTDYQSGTGDIRLEIWKCGLRMWQANPFTGVGAGNFTWVVGDYQSSEQLAKFGRSLGGSIVAHSAYVEMLAELGSIGTVASAVLLWRAWTDLGNVRDSAESRGAALEDPNLPRLRAYADGIRAALVALLINGVFLSIFYYSYVWLLIAIGSALPYVYRRLVAQSPAGSAINGRLSTSGTRHRR